MAATTFARPVSIFVGMGFPFDVETPWDAYQVLTEWAGPRSLAHKAAVESCRAAISGAGASDEARSNFDEFARQAGILAPEAMEAAARDMAEEWYRN